MTRVQDPAFPEWFIELGAVGKVTGYKVVPKGGGYLVTIRIPTGSEEHELTLTVPRRTEGVHRYALALKRVSDTLLRHLPPAQRQLGIGDDPARM